VLAIVNQRAAGDEELPDLDVYDLEAAAGTDLPLRKL
jgi:hypothetical protein